MPCRISVLRRGYYEIDAVWGSLVDVVSVVPKERTSIEEGLRGRDLGILSIAHFV